MTNLGLKRLAFNISGTFARQLAAALLGMCSAIIVARVYGPENKGFLAVAMLLPSMLTSFLNLGVAPANVYYLGSSQVGLRALVHTNLRIYAPLAALGIGAGSVILLLKSDSWFAGVPQIVLWVALATYPFSLLNGFLISLFQGLQNFRIFNFLKIGQSLLSLGLILGLVISGFHDVIFLVVAQILVQVTTFSATIIFLKKSIKNSDTSKVPENFVKRTLGYGWKAHLSNTLAFVNYKADIFLVNWFIGPVAVGVYVVSVALAEKLWIISGAVSTVLLPRLSQLSSDEKMRQRLTPIVTRWVLSLTFISACALGLISSPLITLLFGSDFSEALYPLWILLPGIVVGSASKVIANDIAARGKPELNMYTSFVVVIVNILGNLVLIPPYGLLGAAGATTAAYLLNFVLRLLIYNRLTGNHCSESLLMKTSDVILLKSACRILVR